MTLEVARLFEVKILTCAVCAIKKIPKQTKTKNTDLGCSLVRRRLLGGFFDKPNESPVCVGAYLDSVFISQNIQDLYHPFILFVSDAEYCHLN